MSAVTEQFVKTLNEAFKTDPNAIYALQAALFPCNKELADHPTIVVRASAIPGDTNFNVGVVGLINGCLSALGEPLMCTIWDEAPDLEKDDFRNNMRLTGFAVYQPPVSPNQST
jgi:hypothetical protein